MLLSNSNNLISMLRSEPKQFSTLLTVCSYVLLRLLIQMGHDLPVIVRRDFIGIHRISR